MKKKILSRVVCSLFFVTIVSMVGCKKTSTTPTPATNSEANAFAQSSPVNFNPSLIKGSWKLDTLFVDNFNLTGLLKLTLKFDDSYLYTEQTFRNDPHSLPVFDTLTYNIRSYKTGSGYLGTSKSIIPYSGSEPGFQLIMEPNYRIITLSDQELKIVTTGYNPTIKPPVKLCIIQMHFIRKQ